MSQLSGLFRLNQGDFTRGAVTAIFTAIVAVLWSTSQQPNFDVFSIDWHAVVNAAVYGFVGYIAKNLNTDANGKILGKF